jgi:fatty-acyl-CoA synthase
MSIQHTTLLQPLLSRRESDMTAIVYVATDAEPITVTWREFYAQVQRYQRGLVAHGLAQVPAPDEQNMVVIAHTQSLESIYLFWAAMLTPHTLPSMFPTLTAKLDPAIYTRSMAELVTNSAVKAVITTAEFAPTLADVVPCPTYAASDLTSDDAQPVADAQPDPADMAFLQHSSGTTGLQKGVALSHRAVLNQLTAYGNAIALSQRDVVVSWLPLYHDMGLIAGFLLPLVQGVPLVLMSPFDWVSHPALLLRAIGDYNGTLCWLPNFAYNHMARRVRARDLDGIDLRSMRMFINCSEPVYYDSHQQFVNKFADYGARPEMLAVSYAMAENTFAVTQTAPGSEPHLDVIDRVQLETAQHAVPVDADAPNAIVQVSCGPPISNSQVRVVDESGADLPERRVGELAVKSDSMLTEYYKRPDLNPFTAAGWYRTGDMGYVAGGEVYVVGRKKDLIINAGKNVYPQDIEAIVNTVEGIKPGRAVVFGVPDEREGTELLAVVAEVTDDDPDAHPRIKKAVRQQVARQSTVSVSYVTLVEGGWLIKTSSGKVARAANRTKWLQQHSS